MRGSSELYRVDALRATPFKTLLGHRGRRAEIRSREMHSMRSRNSQHASPIFVLVRIRLQVHENVSQTGEIRHKPVLDHMTDSVAFIDR